MKELTIAEVEALVGRVDRRRKYAENEDGREDEESGARVFALTTWSHRCSGCSGDGMDGSPSVPLGDIGMGCHECGYTGRRRSSFWLPYFPQEKRA